MPGTYGIGRWPTCPGLLRASSASFKPCLQGSPILLLVCSISCSCRSWCSISYAISISYALLRARFYALLPPYWRPIVADWLGEIDHALGGGLRGQFTIALVLAT